MERAVGFEEVAQIGGGGGLSLAFQLRGKLLEDRGTRRRATRPITAPAANSSRTNLASMTARTSSGETGTTRAPRCGYSLSSPAASNCKKASRTGVRDIPKADATSPSLINSPPGNSPVRTWALT